MIAPDETYKRGTKHRQQSMNAPPKLAHDTAREPAAQERTDRERNALSPSKLIEDNPIIALASALTLGVALGWLVKQKLGK